MAGLIRLNGVAMLGCGFVCGRFAFVVTVGFLLFRRRIPLGICRYVCYFAGYGACLLTVLLGF